MKILILGYSNLGIRRIIPVLKKNFKKIEFEICSISKSKKNIGEKKWFRNYKTALDQSNADIVYISLQNSLHFYWAKKFLEKKYHVIVDKPATLSFSNAAKLVKIAKQNKRLLSEATVFNYHKQISEVLKEIKGIDNLRSVNARFVIPKLPKNDFRNITKYGGGCFNDMSPYAASVFRLFLNKKPSIKNITPIFKNKKKLNVSFSIFASYKKIDFSSYFSHDGNYQNELIFITNKKIIRIYRAFSPPNDKKLNIFIYDKKKNKNIIKTIKKDDVFINYFDDIFKTLKTKKFKIFYQKLLTDSFFREKIKKNYEN